MIRIPTHPLSAETELEPRSAERRELEDRGSRAVANAMNSARSGLGYLFLQRSPLPLEWVVPETHPELIECAKLYHAGKLQRSLLGGEFRQELPTVEEFQAAAWNGVWLNQQRPLENA